MKLPLFLLLGLWSGFSAVAQSPSPPEQPAQSAAASPTRSTGLTLSPIRTADDLRRSLVGTTWTWQFGRGKPRVTLLTFADDGTARTEYWTAKFTVLDSKEVELTLGLRKANMAFDSTYSHYQGMDFDKSPIQGAPNN